MSTRASSRRAAPTGWNCSGAEYGTVPAKTVRERSLARLRVAAGLGHQFRDAEVGDDDAPGLLLDHDVDGLDVAVDDGLGLLAVGVVQRVGRLDAHPHDFAQRKAFVLARVQELTQVLPADQLHREEVGLAVLPEVVDPHDVAVLEAEHHLRFGEEALDDVLGAAGARVLSAFSRPRVVSRTW